LKILFYNHAGQVSGAEHVMLLVLARLNRGFHPEVICPAGELRERAASLGVPCHEADSLKARFTWRIDHLVRYLGSFARLIRQVRAQITSADPALIHANSVRAGLVTTLATVGLDVPIVWHVHDMLPRHPLSTAIRLVALCSHRTRIIAISKACASRFRGKLLRGSKARGRLTVILNAVDLEKFHPDDCSRLRARAELQLKPSDQVIGIVGQLTPRKGQLELLEAFALVLRQLPRAILIVVGAPLFNQDDEYWQLLTQTAETLGIEDRVRFLGARDDIAAITRAMDLLVVNSRVEPFGLVVLEGMACGTPVLATAVDGIPEIINSGEDGWLVPPGDKSALVAGIVHLVCQRGLAASLSAGGREKVRARFTAERYMTEIQEFYEGSKVQSPKSNEGKNRVQSTNYKEQYSDEIL
jgi:glycosyltransferase involved in cell wall biosynthesis